MSIKPILFSTPMVQAIMDGRKNMTRRVINPQPTDKPRIFNDIVDGYNIVCHVEGKERLQNYGPKYQPGDVLWVRETWANVFKKIEYRSNFTDYQNERRTKNYGITISKWRPSIFMPKEACRLFLHVTDVRAERLQEITESDAWDEGAGDPYDYQQPDYYEQPHMQGIEYKTSAFAGLWDSINAKRGYGWGANPWVWVYTFERIDKPEGWPNV